MQDSLEKFALMPRSVLLMLDPLEQDHGAVI